MKNGLKRKFFRWDLCGLTDLTTPACRSRKEEKLSFDFTSKLCKFSRIYDMWSWCSARHVDLRGSAFKLPRFTTLEHKCKAGCIRTINVHCLQQKAVQNGEKTVLWSQKMDLLSLLNTTCRVERYASFYWLAAVRTLLNISVHLLWAAQ